MSVIPETLTPGFILMLTGVVTASIWIFTGRSAEDTKDNIFISNLLLNYGILLVFVDLLSK
jgi:hypothetical protein